MIKHFAAVALAATVGVGGGQYASKSQVNKLQEQVVQIGADRDLMQTQIQQMMKYENYTMQWVDCLRTVLNSALHSEIPYDNTACTKIGAK